MAATDRGPLTAVGEPIEEPVFFPAGDETLFGILTRPTSPANGSAVLILAGGATPVSTNRNRLSVRLCRGVAASGYHAFRLDYHGAGESTGVVERMRLDHPFDLDADGAIRWMRGRGLRDFVLIGSCFGSRTALAQAAVDDEVTRLILVAAPVRDMALGDRGTVRSADEWNLARYLLRALNPRVLSGWFDRNHRRVYRAYAKEKWKAMRRARAAGGAGTPSLASPLFVNQIERVLERGAHVLFVYGERDGYHADFRRALVGPLGAVIENARTRVDVRVLPGQVHGFTRLDVQDAVLREIEGWLEGQDPRLEHSRTEHTPAEGASTSHGS